MKTVGLIPSAGIASRLFPQTKSMNKLMMPVAGKPVVDYLIQEFVDAGVKEVYITGRCLDQIKEYFSEGTKIKTMAEKFGHPGSLERLKISDKNIKINYIADNVPRGWVAEVKKISALVKNSQVIVAFSDILYDEDQPAVAQLIESFKTENKSISCNGRYLFDTTCLKFLDDIDTTEAENDVEREVRFLQKLSKNNSIHHLQVKENAHDVGDWLSWLKTNTVFSMKSKEFGSDYTAFLNENLG